MSRLSNYEATRRKCMMLALGETIMGLLSIAGSIVNLMELGSLMNMGKYSRAAAENSTQLFAIIFTTGLIVSLFVLVLWVGITQKSTVLLSIWIFSNLTAALILFGGSIYIIYAFRVPCTLWFFIGLSTAGLAFVRLMHSYMVNELRKLILKERTRVVKVNVSKLQVNMSPSEFVHMDNVKDCKMCKNNHAAL